MRVYCIVVTYNGMQWLDKCFGSLRGLDYPVKTIVVDNGSTDGTQQRLRTNFPEVHIMQAESNLGFGKANNAGIKAALLEGAQYIFLLNQDAYILRLSFKKIISYFGSHKNIGIISPVHFASDERNLDFMFYEYVQPSKTPNFLGDMIRGTAEELYTSQFINAAAWIFNADFIRQVGMFHPAFDHYGEDRELVSRMKNKGFTMLVDSGSVIVHDRIQNRLTNKYHRYNDDLKRQFLQALIEKRISFAIITVRYIRLGLLKLAAFQFSNLSLLFKNWKWLRAKKHLLKSLEGKNLYD